MVDYGLLGSTSVYFGLQITIDPMARLSNVSRAVHGLSPRGNTAQWLTLAIALLIAYLSLHPLSAIRFIEHAPWGFLSKPWTTVGLTAFDVGVNVLAYIPLGFGLLWVQSRRRARLAAVLLAFGTAGTLSLALESLQSYSPARVASVLDVLSNSAGGLLGAVLASLVQGRHPGHGLGAEFAQQLAHSFADRLRGWGRSIALGLTPHGGPLWAVIGLWALAQLHPQGWAFMTAPLSVLTQGWLPTQGVSLPLNAAQLRNLEAIICTVTLSSMLCLIRLGLAHGLRLRARAAVLLAAVAVLLGWQMLAYCLHYGWGEWRLLFSAGVLDAAPSVAAAWLLWTLLPRPWVGFGAVMGLALHIALAQMLPSHPYTAVATAAWQQERLVHLRGLTTVISALWPMLALAALVLQSRYRRFSQ
jgi:VanZ family protein